MTRRNRRASRVVRLQRCVRCRRPLGENEELCCRKCAAKHDRPETPK